MSNSRFRRLVSLGKVRHEDCNTTESSRDHIGDYIGSIPSATSSRRGLHDHCWEAKGETRGKYCELLPQIKTFLETCLEVTSFSDIVISFYMIGPNPMNALPTVTLISEDASSRQSAKKLLKKSEIISHDGFKVLSLSRDPGVQSMKRLASGDAGEGLRQLLRAASRMELNGVPKPTLPAVPGTATEVFINPSQPFSSSSILIYIRHGATFRPATAFPTRIGSRIYLRTVQHAFVQSSTSLEEHVSDGECGDIDVDYDSDEDLDALDDFDVAMTSIGSQSPDDWPDSGSDTDDSIHSRTTSGRSTAPLNQSAIQESDLMVQGLRLASADLAAFESRVRAFSPTKIDQPDPRDLVCVGKLIDSSVDLDCALIETTRDKFQEQLDQALRAASGTIIQKPQENSAIIAHTSSGGSLNGIISATPSLVRLPGARQVQEVYTIRLEGPLANGDCGSAVRDQSSKSLYGHIILGCPATGTAYVLAAHQVLSYIERIAAHFDTHALDFEEDQTRLYSPRSVMPSASQHAEHLTSASSGRRSTARELARATSAAPPFFSPFAARDIKFVDGAVSADKTSAKNRELDESDVSSVDAFELEPLVETQRIRERLPASPLTYDVWSFGRLYGTILSWTHPIFSLVAKRSYGRFSSSSISERTKIATGAVRTTYPAFENGPSDKRQKILRILYADDDDYVEVLVRELNEADMESGNEFDASRYRHVFNSVGHWLWNIRVLASILALPPTFGLLTNQVFACIKIATLGYLFVLGLFVSARPTPRRYDEVGESSQGPNLGFGASILAWLVLAIFTWAGIECIAEMIVLFPAKATRSQYQRNAGTPETMRNRHKFPADHSKHVSSRRVLSWLGQAILCLSPYILGVFLGYVEFSIQWDYERAPAISLLYDVSSFGIVFCWTYGTDRCIDYAVNIVYASVACVCSMLQSLTKLGSRIAARAKLQLTVTNSLSFLAHNSRYQQNPGELDAKSFQQSPDLAWVIVTTGIVVSMIPGIKLFYPSLAECTLWVIAILTAELIFQRYFWGYFSISDTSLASLTRYVVATLSVNRIYRITGAALAQILLTCIAFAIAIRSLKD